MQQYDTIGVEGGASHIENSHKGYDSPYVINEFLEDSSLDVAIHIVDYRNGKTVIKKQLLV